MREIQELKIPKGAGGIGFLPLLVMEQQKTIEEKNQIIEDRTKTIRVRIATIDQLRQAGVLTGCRLCAKRPFCAGCGCETRKMPEDGVFKVPAPIGKVEIFSIHPDGSFSKEANGPYETIIRVREGASSEFWKFSNCLIVGY